LSALKKSLMARAKGVTVGHGDVVTQKSGFENDSPSAEELPLARRRPWIGA